MIGSVFRTNEGYDAIVVKYLNKYNVFIQIQDCNKHEMWVHLNALRKGQVKNPFHRSVMSVGFIGVGDYKVSLSGAHTPAYACWKAMITRCYSGVYHNGKPTYLECKVSPEWQNFQVFAEWYYNQPNHLIFELDKDILIKGNKTYSENTCCMVPSVLNALLTKRHLHRGLLPIGVCRNKLKYEAWLNIRGRRKSLGLSATASGAFDLYKRAKENYIRDLVENDFSEVLGDNIKQALLQYTVEIND